MGIRAGGAAHDSLTRVRLLHAALRHWLPSSGRLAKHKNLVPSWMYVDGEVPLCQQDLAITLSVFCYVNLRNLRRMNIYFSRTDIDAYTHMWRYAGYVLGIDAELLPVCIEDQEEFMLASMLHQGAPEYMGKIKVKKFVDEFAKAGTESTRGLLPFSMSQSFLYQMIVYLNGGEYLTGMEIEDQGPWHWSVMLTKMVGFLLYTLLPRYVPFGEEA